jgi:hypothetical protein
VSAGAVRVGFAWAVIALASSRCGGGGGSGSDARDAAGEVAGPRVEAAIPGPTADAPVRDASGQIDSGPGAAVLDSGRDVSADRGQNLDAAPPPDAGAGGTRCGPGNTCTGSETCELSCSGGRTNRCVCSVGLFFCTGCTTPDSGTGDSRNCPGNANVDGEICRQAGDVCVYRADAGQRFCACGNLITGLFWICQ